MNIFKQFIKSLYSPKDMALFRFQGMGKTILYVFFLSLVSIIPLSIQTVNIMNEGFDIVHTTIKDELPPFIIEEGQLYADVNEATIIEKDGLTVILDSTGELKQRTIKKHDNAIALLKDELIVVTGGQVQATPYSTLSALTITSEDLSELLAQMDSALPVVLIITMFIFLLIGSGLKFMEVTLLAFFGLVLRNITGHQLQFQQTWKLSAYAVTIPTVFFTIMGALQTAVPSSFLIKWGVSIMILFLILKEIPQPKQSTKQ